MDIFYTNIPKSDYKTQHYAGLYLIEYAAKNVYKLENSEIEIINKKPKFKYSNDVHFSISHTKNIVAVCFDDKELGFDIEQLKERDYIQIAKRMKFDLKENTLECFYKNWTLYEAKYKLHQTPIGIYTAKLNNNYIYSIASSQNTDIQSALKIFCLEF